MKKMRLALKSLLVLVLLLSLAACSTNTKQTDTNDKTKVSKEKKEASNEKMVIKVGAPKAPPVIPVLKMIEDSVFGENVKIEIDYWETPEQLISMIQSKKNDMYAFPLTVIAKLYNKGMGVKLTNVNTWGVSYFMSSDPNFKTWSDLKGKKVYVPLQSSPPDIMTQYFLDKAGVGKNDVEIIYGSKTELAQMMMAGKVQYGTMIEPLVSAVTIKNPKMKVALSFEDEWKRVRNTDKKIPNAGFGVTTEFADKNHDFIEKFEKEYEKALKWINEKPELAAKMAESKLGMKKPIIMKAIPNMGLSYKSAMDAKPELDDLYKLLYDFDPKTVGGKIPDEKMYFK